jgi:hypothetical protein
MSEHSAEKDAGVFERAASDEGLLLRAVTEMGSHVEHFNAWFENGVKVRHEDVGGIQCTCGWTHGPEGGFRPWQRFKAHQLQEGLLAVGRDLPPGGGRADV